jgi:hypothetical protein
MIYVIAGLANRRSWFMLTRLRHAQCVEMTVRQD